MSSLVRVARSRLLKAAGCDKVMVNPLPGPVMFRYLVPVLPSTSLETSSPVGDVPGDAVTAVMVMALLWLVRGT
jgi:hypothetical protein